MQNPQGPLGKAVGVAAHSALALAKGAQEIENLKAQEKLTDAQRQVISPAATIGESAGGILEEIVIQTKKRVSDADYGNMDVKNLIKEIPANAKRAVTAIARVMWSTMPVLL